MDPNILSQTLHPSIKLTTFHSDDSPYSSEEEFDVDYLCPKCENPRTNDRWCKYCESKRLCENFQNWTSNNEILDEFIRDTQRNATKNQDYLVWIDYNKLEKVTYLAKGGFSDVYYAVWVEGPERKLVRDEMGKWYLQAKTPVALKCLHDSENINMNLLNELKAQYKCRKGSVLRCYGITQNKETKKYMLVMKYANKGNLRRYLRHNNSKLTWEQKLKMLRNIALGLEEIHSMKLLHRDLHSGNILQHTNSETYVTDFGLCRPVNTFSEEREVYGVLPYIAPEILRRTHDYSEASDIYSFGIIMWEILHGRPPFHNVQHDATLIFKICDGFRPKIEEKGVPKWYISLMDKCWDANPLNRCDIIEVRKIISNRYLTEVHRNDFAGINLPCNVNVNQIPSHPEAVFTSRLKLPQISDFSAENHHESSHAYSEFKSKIDDSETELSHAGSESGLKRGKVPRNHPKLLTLSSPIESIEYSNYFYPSDEEQDEFDNHIDDEEDFIYITRAFDETLSVGDFIKETQN